MNGFHPVGSALPPRRNSLVQAAAGPSSGRFADSINVDLAQNRTYEFFSRDLLPSDAKSIMDGALNGDLQFQDRLFVAMMDSWPHLQKNINEIARKVSVEPWSVIPYSKRGDKPDESAQQFAAEIEDIIWGMRPVVQRHEVGLEDTIRAFAVRYYFGIGVSEIRYEWRDSMWKVRATKSVSARYFGYPDRLPESDPEDRLMYDPEGSEGSRNFVDFPASRFLIGINRAHPGHASMAAPLRALVPYWLAVVFGMRWFMNYCQLYGVPWRHAEVATDDDPQKVGNALQQIGERGWITTKPGTKINMVEGAKSGQALPQRELLKFVDEQCDIFVLGQTLTSGTDDNGSRALGEVHADTRDDMVSAVADWVGGILSHQLIPAIVAVNWGPRDDLPEFWAKREAKKDLVAAATRVKTFTEIGVPMEEAYVYEELGVPVPAAGAKLFEPAKPSSPPPPEGDNSEEEDETDKTEEPGKDGKPKQGVQAGATNPAEVTEQEKQQLLDLMEQALKDGKLLDWKTVALMSASSFVDGMADEKGAE